MKLSTPYIRKFAIVTLSLISFSTASEPEIKNSKEDNLDTAHMVLTTVPLASSVLALSGVPVVPVVLNLGAAIGSQWALCELLGRDTDKIKKSPHSKRFALSLILSLGSGVSTITYFITGSNTYWMINAACSTASALLTMLGTGIMYEELSPKHKPKKDDSSTIWGYCASFWK